MRNDLVSVVITTFGNKTFLTRALNSVKNQTYEHIEVIIVDGKNNKQTHNILKSYKFNKSKYIGLKNDYGTIFARNTGCKSATGVFIALLDDDDEWYPLKLEKQIDAFRDNVGIVGCFTYLFYDDINQTITLKPKQSPEYKDMLKGFEMSPTSSLIVKSSVMKEVGYFSESLVFPEYDLALRILKKGYKMVCVPEFLLRYYQQAKQKKLYSKKPINTIRIIELINFLKMYQKDFWKYLSCKDILYNYIRCFILFLFLGFGGILNQNTVVILERISYYQRRNT